MESHTKHRILVVDLGCMAYRRVHALQHHLVDLRQQNLIPDVLLLVEHEPVITLGRRGDTANILASPDALAELGVDLLRVERGGDVTYHGPGQLVAYPILYLPDHHLGASDYMHGLEQVVRDTLLGYGIATHLRAGIIGVWVGQNKIAALGVRIRRRVTFHGLALNVAPDMTHWSLIVPCGITNGGVTSLALELEHPPSVAEVRKKLCHAFSARFDADLQPIDLASLGIDLNALPQEP